MNAVAHRDYASNAAVQVMLFADRLEVWNPGELPSGLTPQRLKEPHTSIPRNPLIAEPLYLAHYIEKAGTGTLDMIAQCRDAGLPEPDFEQRSDQFVVTLWRDWLTTQVIASLDLNERQQRAIKYISQERHITTIRYQEITGASRATTKRDLSDLVKQGVLVLKGAGRGAYYEVPKKRLINGSNGSLGGDIRNGS